MKNELVIFEGNNVEIIFGDNGQPMFGLYDVGVALGYGRIKVVKGKEYQEIQKNRINTVVKNAEIKPITVGDKQYLTEEMIYDFMFEAKTEKCKAFRKWLSTEVLPSLRKDGGYIMTSQEDTDEEIMAKALLVAHKTIERKNKHIEEVSNKLSIAEGTIAKQAPKVESYEVLISADGLYSLEEAAKMMPYDLGRNKLCKFLRDNGVLQDGARSSRYGQIDTRKHNVPYQKYVDAGMFQLKSRVYNGNVSHTTYVTAKGLECIRKWIAKKGVGLR